MIVVAGEILFDIFDGDARIGGAPFNFAFHLKQMGLSVRFITRVGEDKLGHRIRAFLNDFGFALGDVQIDPTHPTGKVQITLDDRGVPRFDILTDVAYDYLDFTLVPPIDWADVELVYFGTLAQRSAYGFEQWQHFLDSKGHGTKLFCDINLRPPHVSTGTVQAALDRTNILKLNTDELAYIRDMLGGHDPWESFVGEMMANCGLELLALTRGEQGSVLFSNGQKVEAPLLPPSRIIDTVGAGDAYAAVLTAGWLARLPLKRIAFLASEFAGQICGFPGALPDDARVYGKLRKHLPR